VLNIYLKLEGYCPDCLASQVPTGPVLHKASGGTT
jgi:hypothetical protein